MIAASLIDHLSPEDQMKLAYAAWGALVLGVALWSCGVTFARAAVAMVLGAALMLLGLWLPSKLGWNVSPYIGGVIGVASGCLIGGWGFRWVQAATLAACLGLAVAGLYYQWHIHSPYIASLAVPASRSADTLLVQIKPPSVRPSAYGALESIGRKVASIPRIHLQRMAIAGLGSAIAAVLFAMGFPRATTTLITAVLGALGLMAAIYCLSHVYWPKLSDHLFYAPIQTYIMMAVLAAAGLAIQYRFFLRPSDKSQET